jgi:hypothetical protein
MAAGRDGRKRKFMTRYELRTIASHHRFWLRGEREGIAASLRGANLRGDFGEIMRNLGRPGSSLRTARSGHPLSASR